MQNLLDFALAPSHVALPEAFPQAIPEALPHPETQVQHQPMSRRGRGVIASGGVRPEWRRKKGVYSTIHLWPATCQLAVPADLHFSVCHFTMAVL